MHIAHWHDNALRPELGTVI